MITFLAKSTNLACMRAFVISSITISSSTGFHPHFEALLAAVGERCQLGTGFTGKMTALVRKNASNRTLAGPKSDRPYRPLAALNSDQNTHRPRPFLAQKGTDVAHFPHSAEI